MPRKLVTVRRIATITPIPGADHVAAASVDGWTCVVPKGQFAVGDRAVFFEIDSLLPAADERFARFGKGDGKDVRVRTVRIRGVTSQGLLVPLEGFPEVCCVVDGIAGRGEEVDEKLRDVSFEEVLGVKKYEAPEPAVVNGNGKTPPVLADFPSFVPKTDQERIQNLPDVFSTWSDAVFQETTKMDGSSMTIYFISRSSRYFPLLPPLDSTTSSSSSSSIFPNGRVGVCSRNRDIPPSSPLNPLFWRVALSLSLPAKLASLGRDVALQGELCGSSVQANFEGFPAGHHDFFLFSVWDVERQIAVPPREVHEGWAPRLGVRHVPVVAYSRLRDVGGSVEELVKRADGLGVNGRKREGIVLKQVEGKVSFKAISNSYLLKHGE